jgi:predicted small secreted protein
MMRRVHYCAAIVTLALGFVGCSRETQQEAGEAVNQAGQAVESAAEDTANVVDGAVEGASDAVEENQGETPPEE